MMKTIGRLLVRSGRTAGLFIPFIDGKQLLKSGIWEIRETLGEFMLVYIGTPAMQPEKYEGLSVSQLVSEPSAAMTSVELRDAI